MLTAKKKINVREPIQASTFSTNWFQIQNYLREKGTLIGGIAVALVAVALFLYIYFTNKKTENIEANMELAKCAALYEQGQYKSAIDGDRARGIPALKDIADKYSGTSAGEEARLMLGNCYLYTNQLDNAIAAYQSASPNGDMLKAGVLAGLGAAYEGKKEYGKAAEYFEKSATTFVDDQISADRYVQAARNYALAGDKQKAKAIYEKVKNEMKAQRYGAQEIDRLINGLGVD